MLWCVDPGSGYNPLENVEELEQIKTKCSVMSFLALTYISIQFSKHILCQFWLVPHMSSSGFSLRHGQWFKSPFISQTFYYIRLGLSYTCIDERVCLRTGISSQIWEISKLSSQCSKNTLYSLACWIDFLLFLCPEIWGYLKVLWLLSHQANV